MEDYENAYDLDEYEGEEQYELTRPYTEEELAERAEWREMMSELAAQVCAPVISED